MPSCVEKFPPGRCGAGKVVVWMVHGREGLGVADRRLVQGRGQEAGRRSGQGAVGGVQLRRGQNHQVLWKVVHKRQ